MHRCVSTRGSLFLDLLIGRIGLIQYDHNAPPSPNLIIELSDSRCFKSGCVLLLTRHSIAWRRRCDDKTAAGGGIVGEGEASDSPVIRHQSLSESNGSGLWALQALFLSTLALWRRGRAVLDGIIFHLSPRKSEPTRLGCFNSPRLLRFW